MTTNPAWLRGSIFWSTERWGDLWGWTAGRPRPHRGHDIRAAAGTKVPALHRGRVVLIAWSPVLGWYLVVRTAWRKFHGYCHIVPDKALLGKRVKQLQTLGTIAGPLDRPGTAWTGPHLHFTIGKRADSVYQGETINPAETILKVLRRLK